MTPRVPVTESQVNSALDALLDKFNQRITQKGFGTFASRHEILGVITEEYYEFIEASHSKDHYQIREELLDIVVGCIFAVACIDAGTLDW